MKLMTMIISKTNDNQSVITADITDALQGNDNDLNIHSMCSNRKFDF